jgi:NDP-sugar pyrophosphorylase family protein
MDEGKGYFWKEIGDLKNYLECNMWMIRSINDSCFKGFYELFVNEYWESQEYSKRVVEVVEGLWLGENAVIDPSATLIQPVFIGPRTILRPGTVVGPDVILGSDVIVGEGSIVTRSVVLGHTTIKRHTTIDRMVVCDDFKYKAQ